MIVLPAKDPQCLLQGLHGWELHQPIGCHEELEDHLSGLAKVFLRSHCLCACYFPLLIMAQGMQGNNDIEEEALQHNPFFQGESDSGLEPQIVTQTMLKQMHLLSSSIQPQYLCMYTINSSWIEKLQFRKLTISEFEKKKIE